MKTSRSNLNTGRGSKVDSRSVLMGTRAPKPSYSLDFINGVYGFGSTSGPLPAKTLAEIMAISRPGPGGCFNSLGQFEVFPADVARIEHDPVTKKRVGLLIEERRANLHPRSEDFVSASWFKAANTAVLAPEMVTPIGTAHKIIATTAAAAHFLQRTFAVTTGVSFTAWRVMKQGEHKIVRSQLYAAAGLLATRDFDLTTGQSVGNSGTGGMRDLGDGWWLCYLTGTSTYDGNVDDRWYPVVGGQTSFSGNDVDGYYLACAQLESGACPTSYIKTEATSVVREPESPTSALSAAWFNALQGSVVVEYVPSYLRTAAFRMLVSLDDETDASRMQAFDAAVAGNAEYRCTAAGAATTVPSIPAVFGPGLGVCKAGFAYSYKGFEGVANTRLTKSALGITPPSVLTLRLGFSKVGGQRLNGCVASIRYYPYHLTDAALKALTR